MTSDFENSSVGAQRTRRNIMKMGAILAPAALAAITRADAAEAVCSTRLGNFLPRCNCFLKGTKI